MEPADPALVARCEHAETAAFADIYSAAPPAVARAIGLALLRRDGLLAAASRTVKARMGSYVFGMGGAIAAGDDALDAIEAHFTAAGAWHVRAGVAPGGGAPATERALESRGFTRREPWLRLVATPSRVAAAPPATAYPVRELGAADGDAFGVTLCEVFGFAPEFVPWFGALAGRAGWRVFGAFDGARCVGAGALFAADGDGWLGLGGTLAEARGRGAQGAIIGARVAAAREAGLGLLAVETGMDSPAKPNSSTRNLRRNGFAVAYERPLWVKVLRES